MDGARWANSQEGGIPEHAIASKVTDPRPIDWVSQVADQEMPTRFVMAIVWFR